MTDSLKARQALANSQELQGMIGDFFRRTRELERRVERLESEMDTARDLIAQQIKLNLNARSEA